MKKRVLILIVFFAILISLPFLEEIKERVLKRRVPVTTKATQQPLGISIVVISKCVIALKDGWNFISLCANPSNKSVSNVLSSIDGEYRYVMEWNTTRQEFDIYSPKSAPEDRPFTDFNTNYSYFLNYQETTGELSVLGPYFTEDMNLSLATYWNAPTYPYFFNTTIEKLINSVNETYRYVMKWNTTRQEFDIYSPKSAPEDRPFLNISTGQGYFINMPEAGWIYYNKTYFES